MAGGINIGTLAAGLGSGFKNIATAIPYAQSQIANSALRGAQQRDLDWAHQNKVATQENALKLAKAYGLTPEQAEIISRTDMSNGENLIKTLAAMRKFPQMGHYFDAANALGGSGATPQGVVEATKAIQAKQPVSGGYGFNDSIPEVPLPQSQQAVAMDSKARISRAMDALKTLASADAMINEKNQFGQANQYGYQPNLLVGGGEVVDPEMRTAKMTSEQALANQRNSSAMNSRAHAAHVGKGGGGGGRGRGRPRKGGGRGRSGGGRVSWSEPYQRDGWSGWYQKGSNGSIRQVPGTGKRGGGGFNFGSFSQ